MLLRQHPSVMPQREGLKLRAIASERQALALRARSPTVAESGLSRGSSTPTGTRSFAPRRPPADRRRLNGEVVKFSRADVAQRSSRWAPSPTSGPHDALARYMREDGGAGRSSSRRRGYGGLTRRGRQQRRGGRLGIDPPLFGCRRRRHTPLLTAGASRRMSEMKNAVYTSVPDTPAARCAGADFGHGAVGVVALVFPYRDTRGFPCGIRQGTVLVQIAGSIRSRSPHRGCPDDRARHLDPARARDHGGTEIDAPTEAIANARGGGNRSPRRRRTTTAPPLTGATRLELRTVRRSMRDPYRERIPCPEHQLDPVASGLAGLSNGGMNGLS